MTVKDVSVTKSDLSESDENYGGGGGGGGGVEWSAILTPRGKACYL